MLALVAGCGGSEVAVQEVPGDPVELTVPGDGDALAPARDRHADADADARRRTIRPPRRPRAAAAAEDTGRADGAEGTDGGGTEAPAGDRRAAAARLRLRGQRGVLRAESRRLLSPPLKFLAAICRFTGPLPYLGRQEHTANCIGHQG